MGARQNDVRILFWRGAEYQEYLTMGIDTAQVFGGQQVELNVG